MERRGWERENGADGEAGRGREREIGAYRSARPREGDRERGLRGRLVRARGWGGEIGVAESKGGCRVGCEEASAIGCKEASAVGCEGALTVEG